jgi:hypothetical protein
MRSASCAIALLVDDDELSAVTGEALWEKPSRQCREAAPIYTPLSTSPSLGPRNHLLIYSLFRTLYRHYEFCVNCSDEIRANP